jgi:hypothetical protein
MIMSKVLLLDGFGDFSIITRINHPNPVNRNLIAWGALFKRYGFSVSYADSRKEDFSINKILDSVNNGEVRVLLISLSPESIRHYEMAGLPSVKGKAIVIGCLSHKYCYLREDLNLSWLDMIAPNVHLPAVDGKSTEEAQSFMRAVIDLCVDSSESDGTAGEPAYHLPLDWDIVYDLQNHVIELETEIIRSVRDGKCVSRKMVPIKSVFDDMNNLSKKTNIVHVSGEKWTLDVNSWIDIYGTSGPVVNDGFMWSCQADIRTHISNPEFFETMSKSGLKRVEMATDLSRDDRAVLSDAIAYAYNAGIPSIAVNVEIDLMSGDKNFRYDETVSYCESLLEQAPGVLEFGFDLSEKYPSHDTPEQPLNLAAIEMKTNLNRALFSTMKRLYAEQGYGLRQTHYEMAASGIETQYTFYFIKSSFILRLWIMLRRWPHLMRNSNMLEESDRKYWAPLLLLQTIQVEGNNFIFLDPLTAVDPNRQMLPVSGDNMRLLSLVNGFDTLDEVMSAYSKQMGKIRDKETEKQILDYLNYLEDMECIVYIRPLR